MLYHAKKFYRWDETQGEYLSIALSPSKEHVLEAVDSFLNKIEKLHNEDPFYRCDAIVMIRITTGGNNEVES